MAPIDTNRLWSAVYKRGHVQTESLAHPNQPGTPSFCPGCGALVITHCGRCGAALLGGHRGVVRMSSRPPKPFCHECGAAHRRATREQRIRQLENLLEFEDLEPATQLAVIEEIAVLAKPVDEDSDDSQVRAGERIKELAPSLWETGKPILQSLLTEAAKRRLGFS